MNKLTSIKVSMYSIVCVFLKIQGQIVQKVTVCLYVTK